jgi:hypothetical protein
MLGAPDVPKAVQERRDAHKARAIARKGKYPFDVGPAAGALNKAFSGKVLFAWDCLRLARGWVKTGGSWDSSF